MLTPQEVEKFANWIIKKENEAFDARWPIPEGSDKMTDEELLAELFS